MEIDRVGVIRGEWTRVLAWAVRSLRSPKPLLEDLSQGQRGQAVLN